MALQDDLNGQVTQIKSDVASIANQAVAFNPVKTAMLELANAIDALGGNTAAARAAINNIQATQAVGFDNSKSALDGLVSLLIDQSNFSGGEQ
jgi:hypothetical protein